MDLCAVANDHPVWVQMNGEYKAILTKNACSVNPVTGLAHDGKSLAPYIPPLKQVGFTGQVITVRYPIGTQDGFELLAFTFGGISCFVYTMYLGLL